ncbi:DUF2273 domain-containing protein [Paenibacillus thailandensis]|uniref:DUF2273 domain-containing protein n=1 Tax=Paenibacillus thailandensis TaxID=393250 RepID=A0ABW5QYM9_9BACL
MWREFLASCGKRVLGAAAGLFFGIIYLISGFWDMLVVGLLVSAGYWIGKQKELRQDPLVPLRRIWQYLSNKIRLYK